MAIFRLKGDATDWSDTSSWYGGTVPPSGTTTIVVIGESGSKAVTAGLDQSAVSINRIVRLPGVRKKIGGNGASLQIDVDNGTSPAVIDYGAGGTDFPLYIDGSLPEVQLRGSAYTGVTGGALGDTLLYVGGNSILEVSDTATIGATAGGGVVRIAGGSTAILSHATDQIGDLIAYGGTFSTERDIVTGVGAGSSTVIIAESATVTDGLSGGKFTMASPGHTLMFRNTEAITLDEIIAIAGRPDFSKSVGDVTFAAGTIDASNVKFPDSYPGGETDTSSATIFGDDIPQDSI